LATPGLGAGATPRLRQRDCDRESAAGTRLRGDHDVATVQTRGFAGQIEPKSRSAKVVRLRSHLATEPREEDGNLLGADADAVVANHGGRHPRVVLSQSYLTLSPVPASLRLN
jgi:hypothetical protein